MRCDSGDTVGESTFQREVFGRIDGNEEIRMEEKMRWEAAVIVLRSGIMPIGLAASGNLFCIIAFSSFRPLVHECDSLAVSTNKPHKVSIYNDTNFSRGEEAVCKITCIRYVGITGIKKTTNTKNVVDANSGLDVNVFVCVF
nr:hypothetical protein AEK19_MT2140, mitochondrial [Tanacetum cinerariifolium]